jgi:predicted TIM-barrel fold metal-dependent hydrolase
MVPTDRLDIYGSPLRFQKTKWMEAGAMDYRVISSDDHVTEPPDIFERRLPARLRTLAPRVQRQTNGEDVWVSDGRIIARTGIHSARKLKVPFDKRDLPGTPLLNYDSCERGIWEPYARLKDYDANGVDAGVLFPDFLPGFTGNPFWSLDHDPELRIECLKAWNDWEVEDFCAVSPHRLISQCLLPVWDVRESVKELVRCAKKGHKGVTIGGVLDIFGYPTFFEPHWDPIWEAAQELDIVISFHQQSAQLDRRKWTEEDRQRLRGLSLAQVVWHVCTTQVPLIDILFSGVLERFPRLKIFIGEGGVGWIPYVLTQADFFWERNRASVKPDLSMPPSEYWRRQVFAGFWYERIDEYILEQLGEDNILWEDDYPHQLSDSPNSGKNIELSLARVADQKVRHKILAGNAVKLFNLGE